MSHVMKGNHYYFLSAYCALRLGLNSVNLLFLILIIKLKERVPENTLRRLCAGGLLVRPRGAAPGIEAEVGTEA